MTETKTISFLENLAAVLFMVIVGVPIVLFCACRIFYGKSLWRRALRYNVQGSYAEAEPLLRRALTIMEKAIGPEHPTVARGLVDYAALLRELGREEPVSQRPVFRLRPTAIPQPRRLPDRSVPSRRGSSE